MDQQLCLEPVIRSLAMLRLEYPLRTERLLLRPYQRCHLDYLADIASRAEVVRYLYEEVRDRQEVSAELELRSRLRSIEKEGDRLLLVVERAEDGVVVGDVNLHFVSDRHRQGEVGWVFHPNHQGKGYATEAATEMLRLGFDELGLHRISARCDARNAGSVGVMERLGMRREAHFVENEFFKGEWADELVYAMLASEWEEKRVSNSPDPGRAAPGR